MANVVERQILEEGPRNAVVKLAGILDTGDYVGAPALRLSDFLTNDVPNTVLVGLRLDECQWSISNGLLLNVFWNSANPQLILALAGWDEICVRDAGGLQPDQNRPAYDGAINVISANWPPGTVANFTLVMKFVKLYRF